MIVKISFIVFSMIFFSNGETHCQTDSWWLLIPFSKTILKHFLSQSKQNLSFDVENPLSPFIEPDQHPVYLEFNRQYQCSQTGLPDWLANATEQTFVEFKLQIPYLIHQNQSVLLKPLIYQNSRLDVTASQVVYGLPTFFATMEADFDQNIYTISTNKGSLRASFQPLTEDFQLADSPSAANFSSFIDANRTPWLAFPPLSIFNRVKCASNIYNFHSGARVRPVLMSLSIVDQLLDPIPPGNYKNIGNQPMGAWQVDLKTTISSVFDCS